MTSLTATAETSRPANSSSTDASAVRLHALIAGLVLAAFGAYSVWVVADHGFSGLASLLGRESWALQLFIDLTVSLYFAFGWLRADARRRGLNPWPYIAAALGIGSLSVLIYMVRRGFAPAPRPAGIR